MCQSAKHWNEGLITLHTYDGDMSFCEGWDNVLSVKFKSSMSKYVSLHDERLFVIEQFVRQYKLWEIYE